MIAFNIYNAKYDWLVRVFVKVAHVDADEVMEALEGVGCSDSDMSDAMMLLSAGEANQGMCFSNPKERVSVMVITRTSSPKEFLNSLVHETAHLGCHIALEDRIDLRGERLCYIQGEFARSVYPYVKDLLCGCGRRNMYRALGYGI